MLRKSSLEESTSTKTSVTTLHSMLLEMTTHGCYRNYEVRHFLDQIHTWIFTQDGVQGCLLLNTLQTFVKLRRLSEHICILRNPWLNNIVRMEIHGISFFLRFSFFFTRYLLQVSGPNKTTITSLVSSKNHKYTNFLNLWK